MIVVMWGKSMELEAAGVGFVCDCCDQFLLLEGSDRRVYLRPGD